jgi:hypothetical protein
MTACVLLKNSPLAPIELSRCHVNCACAHRTCVVGVKHSRGLAKASNPHGHVVHGT